MSKFKHTGAVDKNGREVFNGDKIEVFEYGISIGKFRVNYEIGSTGFWAVGIGKNDDAMPLWECFDSDSGFSFVVIGD